MKAINSFLVLLFFSATKAAAGIPDGYYSSADGLKSAELKSAIAGIISIHKTLSYSSLWDYYPYTYYVPGDVDRIFDMYSSAVTYFSDYSNMNKEHVVPKSWWGGSTDSGPGCDLYNVIPGEQTANNAKSNYPLGIVGGAASFDNGVVKVGPSGMTDYTGTVFEPADNYKGDFARIYFYVATCYPDLAWDHNKSEAMTNSSWLTLQTWIIPMLIEWNASDPVDEAEIQRNEDICKYQQNRNPFIDYPDLADYIWGADDNGNFYFADHKANEGSSNDNMKTKVPSFSVDYGTEENPKEVAEGSEVTVKGGTTQSVLHTRTNGGEWEETESSSGSLSSGNTYNTAATKTFTITGDVCIEAFCSLDGYADSNTIKAYYRGTDFDSSYLLYEAFDELTAGNNTSTLGSSTKWTGNDNFPEVSSVYCAGNVLRMGASGTAGSITSRELDTPGGTITVEFDVKGWTTIEGSLKVEMSGADPRTVSYTATMTDEFEHKTLTFNNVSPYATLTVSTTAKRAFIDNITVTGLANGVQSVVIGDKTSNAAYNLSGQRVDAGNYKGIIIRNGIKILK